MSKIFNNNYHKGYCAELFAIQTLKTQGLEILKQRYKTKYGEIDIIAEKNQELYFFEIKYRKNLDNFEIKKSQIKRIYNSIKIFTENYEKMPNINIVVMIIDQNFNFKYIKNIYLDD